MPAQPPPLPFLHGTCSHPWSCAHHKTIAPPHCLASLTTVKPQPVASWPPIQEPPGSLLPPCMPQTNPRCFIQPSALFDASRLICRALNSNTEVYGSVWVATGLVTYALNSFASLAVTTWSILQTLVQSSQGNMDVASARTNLNLLSLRPLSPGHLDRCCFYFWCRHCLKSLIWPRFCHRNYETQPSPLLLWIQS